MKTLRLLLLVGFYLLFLAGLTLWFLASLEPGPWPSIPVRTGPPE